MTAPSQTLPEAPIGAVEYTADQLAEMVALPSRKLLSDGKTENPKYDPRMDPGSDVWDAYAYFARQEQVEIFIYPDPESPEMEVDVMSINGFSLPYYPNKRNRMPRDFVEQLKQRNHRFDVLERGLVSRNEDAEGALTLSVGGAKAKPFVRRVAG